MFTINCDMCNLTTHVKLNFVSLSSTVFIVTSKCFKTLTLWSLNLILKEISKQSRKSPLTQKVWYSFVWRSGSSNSSSRASASAAASKDMKRKGELLLLLVCPRKSVERSERSRRGWGWGAVVVGHRGHRGCSTLNYPSIQTNPDHHVGPSLTKGELTTFWRWPKAVSHTLLDPFVYVYVLWHRTKSVDLDVHKYDTVPLNCCLHQKV